jgi:hypothetical protein
MQAARSSRCYRGRSTYGATKLRETRRTGSAWERLNESHGLECMAVRRYRTQEVAGSSPASSISGSCCTFCVPLACGPRKADRESAPSRFPSAFFSALSRQPLEIAGDGYAPVAINSLIFGSDSASPSRKVANAFSRSSALGWGRLMFSACYVMWQASRL